MENVVILSSVRTPVGSFQGSLSSLSAPRLGAIAIKEAVLRSGLKGEDIEECIMGEVLTAGVGQAPARQAALLAGLSESVPALTINKVCGSGLKAVMLAADSIQMGRSHIVAAGGQENMSLAPHLLENSRAGYRMGSTQLTDSMLKDGLMDPTYNIHMGNAAEICVREYRFTRESQDEFTIQSYKKAQEAIQKGLFNKELTQVLVESKKGPITVSQDEEPFNTKFDKIPTLKPAFEKDGTITAANSSKINDGAAAHILMAESMAKARGLNPLARIVAQGTFAQNPKYFTTAPTGAIKKALTLAGLSVNAIDLWEINEAFAVVTQVAMKDLQIPAEKVNIHGGAVAIGHPIGASGARILATLVHGLHTHQKRYGLATLCIGGGEAVALIIERI
jgi:acetyl-CoA C-acetyltransferase